MSESRGLVPVADMFNAPSHKGETSRVAVDMRDGWLTYTAAGPLAVGDEVFVHYGKARHTQLRVPGCLS